MKMAPDPEEESMSQEDLGRRIKVLEDVEEIKRLKARYCAHCDDNYNPDGIAGLFTADAVWEGAYGRYQGPEEIRGFFVNIPQRLPFAIHMVLNPNIEVNGDTASGTWYLFDPCTLAEGNRAVWGVARYDDEYVRVDGEWKFKHVRITRIFRTPFDEGWVKTRFV